MRDSEGRARDIGRRRREKVLKVAQALTNLMDIMDEQEPEPWADLTDEQKDEAKLLSDALIRFWEALNE